MKIHIALVGGQLLPIYRGIIEKKAEKVLLLHSNETKNSALNFLTGLSIKNVECQLGGIEALDFKILKQQVLHLAKKYKNDEVEINMTGGSKPMNYVFYEVFREVENVSLFFIDQNNVVTDLKTYESYKSSYNFTIDEMCQVNGHKMKSHTDLKDYTEKDFIAIDVIENARIVDRSSFFRLSHKGFNPKQDFKDPASKNYIAYHPKKERYSLYLYDKDKRKEETFHVKAPNAYSLIHKSGWWEVKVAQLLSKWNKKVDIWVNNVFPTQLDEDQNEIDVIVKTLDKLLFVEAKTQIKKPTDIDKFNSAAKKYGGSAIKKILINYEPFGLKKKVEIQKKCLDYNIIPFSYMEALEKEQKYNISVEKQLFELIDKDYKTSNSK